jgi:hypothetical protein
MSSSYIPTHLRQLVYDRAEGRCEYCLIPESIVFAAHEIDHIIARKHGGRTEADNLALSCALCNQHKGSDLASLDPETGQLVPLYHPRQQRWAEHFQLKGAILKALTPSGRVTIQLLQLNRADRFEEREMLIEAGFYRAGDE